MGDSDTLDGGELGLENAAEHERRKRDRSLSITVSSVDSRPALSDSGFSSDEDDGADASDGEEEESGSDIEDSVLGDDDDEVVISASEDSESRGRSRKRRRGGSTVGSDSARYSVSASSYDKYEASASNSASSGSSSGSRDTATGNDDLDLDNENDENDNYLSLLGNRDGSPPRTFRGRELKPFSIVDDAGRTIRIIQQTDQGPQIIDFGPEGPRASLDMTRDLTASKDKKNALVLGMFYCDPMKFNRQPIGCAAIRDSIRLLELENEFNVYSVDREHTTKDALKNRHFKIDLSNGTRAARSLKQELRERGLGKLRFSCVIGDYFRLPAACLDRLYTRSLFLKFFTAMYDVNLLTDKPSFYLPNSERIRENITDLVTLYAMTPISGADNPLYAATERAPLPDGYSNKSETRTFHDTKPFLLLEFQDSAIKTSQKNSQGLERAFAKLLNVHTTVGANVPQKVQKKPEAPPKPAKPVDVKPVLPPPKKLSFFKLDTKGQKTLIMKRGKWIRIN